MILRYKFTIDIDISRTVGVVYMLLETISSFFIVFQCHFTAYLLPFVVNSDECKL